MLSRTAYSRRVLSRKSLTRDFTNSGRNLKGIAIGGLPSASNSSDPASRTSFAALRGQVESSPPPPPTESPSPSGIPSGVSRADQGQRQTNSTPAEARDTAAPTFSHQEPINNSSEQASSLRSTFAGFRRPVVPSSSTNEPLKSVNISKSENRWPIQTEATSAEQPFQQSSSDSSNALPNALKSSFAALRRQVQPSTSDDFHESSKDDQVLNQREEAKNLRSEASGHRLSTLARHHNREQGQRNLKADNSRNFEVEGGGWGPGLREKIQKAQARERTSESSGQREQQRFGESSPSSDRQTKRSVGEGNNPWRSLSQGFSKSVGRKCDVPRLEKWTVFSRQDEDGEDAILARRDYIERPSLGFQCLSSVSALVHSRNRFLSHISYTLNGRQGSGGYLKIELSRLRNNTYDTVLATRVDQLIDTFLEFSEQDVDNTRERLSLEEKGKQERKGRAVLGEEEGAGGAGRRKTQPQKGGVSIGGGTVESSAQVHNKGNQNSSLTPDRGFKIGQDTSTGVSIGRWAKNLDDMVSKENKRVQEEKLEDRTPIPTLSETSPEIDSRTSEIKSMGSSQFDGIAELFSSSTSHVDEATPVQVDGQQAKGSTSTFDGIEKREKVGPTTTIGGIAQQSTLSTSKPNDYTLKESDSTARDPTIESARKTEDMFDGVLDVFSSSDSSRKVEETTPLSSSEGGVEESTPVHVDGDQAKGVTSTSESDHRVEMEQKREGELGSIIEGVDQKQDPSEIIGSAIDGSTSPSASSSTNEVEQSVPVAIEAEQVGDKKE